MKKLVFRPHAEKRMRERLITEAEVREVLAQPEEEHFYNETHGTMNVRYKFSNLDMTVLVAYEERPDEIVVVSVIDE